jgi:hypothetical protein
VAALPHSIRDRFGRIDVIEYGPISGEQGFTPATKLDAAALEKDSPLLLTTVEVVRAVLAEWTERARTPERLVRAIVRLQWRHRLGHEGLRRREAVPGQLHFTSGGLHLSARQAATDHLDRDNVPEHS